MADRDHDGTQRDADDTDELLDTGPSFQKQDTVSTSRIIPVPGDFHPLSPLTDLNDNTDVFGLDHCDLLLDAIDAQLGQLQVCDLHPALHFDAFLLHSLLYILLFADLHNYSKIYINTYLFINVKIICST